MSSGSFTSAADLERLRAVLDAYGGDPRHWPEDERDTALAVLSRSSEARTLQDAALRLDAALDLLPAAEPGGGLEDCIVAAALAAGPSATTRPVASLDHAHARRSDARRRRGGFLVAALPLAAAAALALWLTQGRTPDMAIRVAATPAVVAEPVAEIALAELGVYETPGDALLEVSGLDDVYDAEPWNGCSEGDLGCLQVDTTLPLEPVSRQDNAGQEVRLLS